MKNRHLMYVLPLAASLAFSQQPASQTLQQGQPADANTTQQTQPVDQTATRQPLELQSHEGFWGHLNPFARKKYIRRQLAPVVGRVNELDELTAKNSKDIQDVDARATEGIRQASLKATEADNHAVDAGNRAQAAQQTATQATQRLQTVETVVSSIDQYKPVSETEIRFRPGQLVLSKRAKAALDEVAQPLTQSGYVVEVQGFSSGRGLAAVENSRRIAESVARYLVVAHNVPVYRIYMVGMGNAPIKNADGKSVRIRGGRVEISLMRNGVGDLQQSAQNNAPVQPGMTSQQAMPQSDNPELGAKPVAQQPTQQQFSAAPAIQPATAPVQPTATQPSATQNPPKQ